MRLVLAQYEYYVIIICLQEFYRLQCSFIAQMQADDDEMSTVFFFNIHFVLFVHNS